MGLHFIAIADIRNIIALRWLEHHDTINRSMHLWLNKSEWIECWNTYSRSPSVSSSPAVAQTLLWTNSTVFLFLLLLANVLSIDMICVHIQEVVVKVEALIVAYFETCLSLRKHHRGDGYEITKNKNEKDLKSEIKTLNAPKTSETKLKSSEND